MISVIIPCYNHGRYLQAAVESVWAQKEVPAEIIVVDDGSTDNTPAVASGLQGVHYVYQKNRGLSAARNTGIRHSKGQYLLFLDADDWLLPDSLHTSIELLDQHPDVAFVSAGHQKIFTDLNKVETVQTEVADNHYRHLLQGNYIGMHATVLYRSKIFDQFQFDETLRACEDYDLYLKIARSHPVLHHTELIAAYRIHGHNMSGNIPMMLHHVLRVLNRQAPLLKNTTEKKALARGKKIWKEYYAWQTINSFKAAPQNRSLKQLVFILTVQPKLAFRLINTTTLRMLKELIKKNLPAPGVRLLQKMGLYKSYSPAPGAVNMGDMGRRVTPFSTDFGYERGGPVDRYYIEGFLSREAAAIHGRVLEIGDNAYTLQYGAHRVTQSDILHIDDTNPQATLIGDLSHAPQIPDESFDAIVLTQTLHLIYDFQGALATCHRILKPGGTLLLTVPGITPIDMGVWTDIWFWSFTDRAMKRLMQTYFPGAQTEVHTNGNVLAASAFLYGMGLPELKKEQLDYCDPQFQVVVTVKAVKAVAS